MSTNAAMPRLGSLERELLLLCGRVQLDAEHGERLEELVGQRLDWDALVGYARLHSVAPLLRRHLSTTTGFERVPAEAEARLLALSHRAEYQNARFADEHAKLARRFDGHAVRAISPKGLSVVELVYGSRSLRPLIDLVYLVSRDDVHAAADALDECGYRRVRRAAVEEMLTWACPQAAFVADRDLPVLVLLFSELVSWPRLHRLRLDEALERAERAQVGGAETWILSPIDVVLYLCLHIDNHGYFNRVAAGSVDPVELLLARWSNNRLVRFTDLHGSIRHYANRLDWPLLVERARAAGVEEPVHVSLSLTNALLGPVVQPEVIAELDGANRHFLRRWAFETTARESGSEGTRLQRVVRERWAARTAAQQFRLVRLLGLAELTFPDVRTLRARYGRVPRPALLPVYTAHTAHAIGATGATFLSSRLRDFASRLRR
jgi:hypothetical protein